MTILDIKSLASIQDVPLILSSISSREILDIFLVSLAFYIILLFVKQTRSYFVLTVSIALIALNFFSQNLNLTLTRSILQPLSTLTFIIIAIVFQREIRRFFRWITTGKQHLFDRTHTISRGVSAEIAEALLYMAKKKIGAIIVFPGKQEIDDIIEGGHMLNGMITKEALLSIFDTGSAGHDGAVIIENDLIKLFGAHLPLARNYNYDIKKAGTRHRAAAGITEDTDSISFVVSEERGIISISKNGTLEQIKGEDTLREILRKLTGESENISQGFWHYFILKNASTKLTAIGITLILWTGLIMQTGIVKKEFSIPLSFQLLSEQYEVDSKAGKTQINVVLQGRSRDITTFDGTKLEAKIDARDFATGTVPLLITEDMITVPSYLSVIDIEPDQVKVLIKEKNAEEVKQEEKII
jgi:diadenylate cyclase